MKTWQIQDAKARLSELIRSAANEGPQEITLHGKSVAVLISREAFDRLSGGGESLAAFMQRSPLYGLDEIDLERDQSLTREVNV
ncbi:MAG: type II toxin-antitoxin system Phd/YefM family antitoxin [Telluria sp.]